MNIENRLGSLLASASLVFFGSVLQKFSFFAERVLIGRTLSVGAYGNVSIGISILTLGTTLALFGFQQGIPRYMSRLETYEEKRGIWVTGLLFAGGTAILMSVLLWTNVESITNLLFEQNASAQLTRLFALAIPFVVIFKIGIAAIRGMENTRFKIYAQDLFYPLSRLVSLIVIFSLGFGIVSPGYAYLVSAFLVSIFAHFLLSRSLTITGSFETHFREILSFSAPLVLSTLFAMFIVNIDTMMMGYFQSSYEVGLYSAAFPIATGMLIVLSSFGFLYLPLASRLDASGEREEVDSIYRITTKWIYIITFPVFITFVVFSGDVLAIFFGEDFRPASHILTILAIGLFTNTAFGRNRETLSALGHTNYILLSNFVVFILNVLLNLVLIPRYSGIGAATASAVSFVILNLLIYVFLRRNFDITPFSKWTVRTFVSLPLILLPATIFLSNWISLTLLTLPLFLIGTGVSSITIVCVSGCLQPEDMVAVESIERFLSIRIPLIRQCIQN